MSTLRRVLLASLAVVLVVGIVGCADQTDEANKLIDQANALVDKSNALDAEMVQLMAEAEKIDPTAKNAADALPMLAKVEAKLGEIKKNAEATVALMDKLSGLDVSDEFKTYAGQQKEIAQLQIKMTAATAAVIAKLKVLYDATQMSKLSEADFNKLDQEIADLVAKADEIDSQISEKQGSSDQFFKDNSLGE